MSRTPVIFVQSAKQWEVILSPVRGALVQALRCLGPCSTGELAKMVDRPPDTLYRHLEQLRRSGFVVETGTRKHGRHVERLFDLTADDFTFQPADLFTAEAKSSLKLMARSFTSNMVKCLEEGLDQDELNPSRGARNFAINYELSWLTPKEYDEVRELTFKIKQVMDKARPNRQGRLYCSLTMITLAIRANRRRSVTTPSTDDQTSAG